MYDWPIIKDIVPIFQSVLVWINSFIHSYGWSIVLMTILFRGVLLPLDIRSKLQMKKQQLLQPKIAKINEKYKNDKEKAAQKTMELYKQEKASPFSGCLPLLLQWPLFIAFFGALNYMASQQIFALYSDVITNGLDHAQGLIERWIWVNNVWAPDTAFFGPGGINLLGLNSSVIPSFQAVQAFHDFKGITEPQYYAVMGGLISRTSANYNGWLLLPILAGITGWIQMKITMPAQPAQQAANQPKNPLSGKSMQYVFLAITIFFTSSSNSVFALYWITSNIVAIATYKGVDMYWKLRDKKLAHEGTETLEEAKQPELKSGEATQKTKPAAGKQMQANQPAGAPAAQEPSSGNAGKAAPKEGKKK